GDLYFGRDTVRTEHLADGPEDHAADHHVPRETHAALDELGDQLLRVAVEQAGDALERRAGGTEVLGRAHAVPALAVAAVREQADGDQAPEPIDAVNADRAHRIVDLDLIEEEDAPDDQHARDRADDERAYRRDERARRRDGHEAGQHAVAHH